MAVMGLAPVYTLIALLTFPVAYALMKRVSIDTEPVALNPVLRKTAQLHARFGLLLVTGWVLAVLLQLVG
jgi:1,4-dihydroxy-2-naphthoate octaprenyltransferase